MLNVTDVRINRMSRELVNVVLKSGQLAQGPMVARLEKAMAALAGTRHAVAVSNGTAALYLALLAKGLVEGDRVIVPAFTFPGTANAVLMAGGVPVFADIGDDWMIDRQHVLELAEEHDTRWLLPVHLFGAVCDVTGYDGMTVVEDAAQALGHKLSYGAVSLYATKTVGCGEGGMVVTNDEREADWIRVVRNHGMRDRYDFAMPGFNFRMTDLQAAVALGQITGLMEVLEARRYAGQYLYERLVDLPIQLPYPFGHLCHQFTIEVPNRDRFRDEMAVRGVETTVHYPQALPDIPWLPDADTPRARQAAERIVSLPVHEHLTKPDLDLIVNATREAVEVCVSTLG